MCWNWIKTIQLLFAVQGDYKTIETSTSHKNPMRNVKSRQVFVMRSKTFLETNVDGVSFSFWIEVCNIETVITSTKVKQ